MVDKDLDIIKKDYPQLFEDHIRTSIVKDISELELPPEWTPNDVIRYIVGRIEKSN
jgi:hypothetical protein